MIQTVWFHRVKDFTTWKKVFDSFYSQRKKYGEKSYSVGTVQGDPNNVYVINEWENTEAFNKFRSSKELENAMKDAGVLEVPKITILDEVRQETYHTH